MPPPLPPLPAAVVVVVLFVSLRSRSLLAASTHAQFCWFGMTLMAKVYAREGTERKPKCSDAPLIRSFFAWQDACKVEVQFFTSSPLPPSPPSSEAAQTEMRKRIIRKRSEGLMKVTAKRLRIRMILPSSARSGRMHAGACTRTTNTSRPSADKTAVPVLPSSTPPWNLINSIGGNGVACGMHEPQSEEKKPPNRPKAYREMTLKVGVLGSSSGETPE